MHHNYTPGHWQIYGGGPNSFDFMQFSGNFGKFVSWPSPPGELVPHPWGNPVSATAGYRIFFNICI